MYSPILRNRQSELLAIQHLSTSIRRHLMPLLDVAAAAKSTDVAKAATYVERNISRTEKCVTDFPAVFVDSSELPSAMRLSHGLHPLRAIADAISRAGGRPIPVTGLHRDAAHAAEAGAIASEQSEGAICIRLDATDVGTATQTQKRIGDWLEAPTRDPRITYVLLDMQCVYGRDKDVVSKQVLRLLTLLKSHRWAGIIVGGYGVPDQIASAVGSKEQAYLRRIEQDVFLDAAAQQMETPRWLADYTTLSPSAVELDWRLIQKVICPKALYALEDSWFVVRGGAFASHPDGHAQYFSIAEEIVALEEYCGADYSFGDAYIGSRANREGTSGSPSSWITACVNHHITFTANAHAGETDG
jgi:T4 beta protein